LLVEWDWVSGVRRKGIHDFSRSDCLISLVLETQLPESILLVVDGLLGKPRKQLRQPGLDTKSLTREQVIRSRADDVLHILLKENGALPGGSHALAGLSGIHPYSGHRLWCGLQNIAATLLGHLGTTLGSLALLLPSQFLLEQLHLTSDGVERSGLVSTLTTSTSSFVVVVVVHHNNAEISAKGATL
jgi:hypothetical protein